MSETFDMDWLANQATLKRGRYGIDSQMRYFTKEFLANGLEAGWSITYLTSPLSPGTLVKHLETGHIWELADEPPEPWCNTHIYLGRWPD